MQYLSGIGHALLVLVLFAALAGASFSTAVEWRVLKAAFAPAKAAIAPVQPAIAPAKPAIAPAKPATASGDAPGQLLFPLPGFDRRNLRDNYEEGRGGRKHEAIDIMAPRGTPVVAVDDGRVGKLFRSIAGGITLYQIDPAERYVYYYAHLDRYADGLHEGMAIKRGDVIGYVGSTGNASEKAPHLHFAIHRLGPEKRWWKGTPINPYPFLKEAA